ncbi:MAG TPA: pilus assembly protein PilM [Thermoguttaceae bacterium]|nr:pilus assembly protein PilM [Thermoguttaceae bacterium]
MESASRTTVSCSQCRQENLPQSNFCAKCGAALWEPCLGCGEPCAAGENFCGACGIRLVDAAAERLSRLNEDFRQAEELASDYRFDEAIERLTPIPQNKHPRLIQFVTRARELTTEWTAQRQRHQSEAKEACRLARERAAVSDYQAAAAHLKRVPPPFQTHDWKDLHDEIAERCREINTLIEEIRQAVRDKRLLDLPARIERLTALKPADAEAEKLHDWVRAQLVALARNTLAKHRYEETLRLLEQMASPRTEVPEMQRMREEATELAALLFDLRNAPVIDATLVAVARRLKQRTPKDARVVRLCGELDRRVRAAGSSLPEEPIPWASPPEQTPLGVSVEWLCGFRKIGRAEELDASELQQRPGCFLTACGLALAGMGRAAVPINLLSVRSTGMLHRVKHIMRSRGARQGWGIDVGCGSLKAVRLSWDDAKQQAVIEDACSVEHSKSLGHVADNDERARIMTESLRAFLSGRDVKGDRVCVGLSGRTTFSRQITIPPVDAAKMAKLVSFEAANKFPMPMDKLAWDFHAFEGAASEEAKPDVAPGREILLVAAKRAMTDSLSAVFKSLKLRVDVLQPDFVGLHNFLVHDYLTGSDGGSSTGTGPVVAALDIGADATNFLVSSRDSLWFHACGVDGQSFNRALSKTLRLDAAEAERRKRSPETAERFSDLYGALNSVFEDLLNEVQRSLSLYAGAQPQRPVERLLGLGGGFRLHGLFRFLRCGR